MAWTAPATAVANSVLTAAFWNAQVRDNLLETAPAKATAAGRILATTGVNSIAERVPTMAEVGTTETTSATSNADLTTVGPSVTVVTGPAAIVFYSARMTNDTAGAQSLMDYAVSGAHTRGAQDNTALRLTAHTGSALGQRATSVDLITGVTAGTNTFKAKYWVSAGTGSFMYRRIGVIPL